MFDSKCPENQKIKKSGLSKAIGILNSAKHFPNFIVGTLNWSKNITSYQSEETQNSMEIWYINKKMVGNPNFSDLFKRTVNPFERAGYTLDIMRQTASILY